ncbi:MAG TPA: hypothetical protein VM513_07130 [Kofleriaceae bacterium]|nr:hypothetical protein [Kofleriaceae bacterium]
MGVHRVELGAVTDGVPVPLPIGPHTLGAQIVVEVDDSNDSEVVGIRSVTSPSGEAVVAGGALVGHPLPIGSTPFGVATLVLPQTSATSAIPLASGTWSVVFDVPAGHTAHAHAFVRTTEDGEFHGGALDVRIYIPEGLMLADPGPAHVVTPATAATDPAVIARLDSFFATLASTFQLERGTVEFLPLPAKFATIDFEGERLEALYNTVPFADGYGVHFVWSNEVTLGGTSVWGNSAWVPGLANSPQRWLSGVVVDVATPYPAAADGMTMVHELGHFLGLFHTTEANRSIHDPIADTPECTSAASTCPDGHNIMFVTFYGASGGSGLTASPHQRRVVWGSPLYRAQ